MFPGTDMNQMCYSIDAGSLLAFFLFRFSTAESWRIGHNLSSDPTQCLSSSSTRATTTLRCSLCSTISPKNPRRIVARSEASFLDAAVLVASLFPMLLLAFLRAIIHHFASATKWQSTRDFKSNLSTAIAILSTPQGKKLATQESHSRWCPTCKYISRYSR
jgi:hypothetical protein